MPYINREEYIRLAVNPGSGEDTLNKETDVKEIFKVYNNVITDSDDKFVSTWLLQKDLWLQCEKSETCAETITLSRGRVISVNPGVTNIGREQRFIHPYIVLGEFQETFIGVPLTNMAFNKVNNEYYLRNVFEVELINPEYEKPFTEYRVKKRTIADIRNISGLDKRRIIKNQLFDDKKFAPKTYLNAISEKIRNTLAIIIE